MTNLVDSRFFLTMTNENLERLCCEPYTSLVSLEVSIASLHTNHMIHFSREALNRHKSAANLAQSVKNLNCKVKQAKSSFNLSSNRRKLSPEDDEQLPPTRRRSELSLFGPEDGSGGSASQYGATVIVERQKPNKNLSKKEEEEETDEEVSRGERGGFSSLQNRQEDFKQSESDKLNNDDEDDDCDKEKREEDEEKTRQVEQVQVFEVDLQRCPNCKWPCARSHLKPMHSSQQIQFNWIRENLMDNFEENVDEIEERCLKHSLWHLLLKCLAFKNKLDDYITCCVMLDDIRLLNIEQFIITRRDEDEIIDRVLVHLGRKVEFDKEREVKDDEHRQEHCFKCKACFELPSVRKRRSNSPSDYQVDEEEEDFDVEEDEKEDEGVSFNLENLFEQFMMRRNADVKKAISRLLKHPKLLNSCRIPAKFYLRVIANYSSSSGGYNFGN